MGNSCRRMNKGKIRVKDMVKINNKIMTIRPIKQAIDKMNKIIKTNKLTKVINKFTKITITMNTTTKTKSHYSIAS